MLKLIIVEDSAVERDNLCKIIERSGFNVSIVADAGDGEQGLELARRHKPDILLTDLVMPKMGGLELAQAVRDELPDTQVVFISAHDDFHYAKSAIELSVHGYIVKPYSIFEVRDVLNSVVDKCLADRSRRENETILREQIRESLPLLRERFLTELLQNGSPDAQKRGAYLGLRFLSGPMAVAVLELDDFPRLRAAMDAEALLVLKLRVLNCIAERLGDAGYGLEMADNRFAVVLSSQGRSQSDLSSELTALHKELKLRCGHSVTMGVGSVATDLSSLAVSCREATLTLERKFFYSKDSVIWNSDLPQSDVKKEMDLEQLELELFKAVKSGDEEEAQRTAGAYIDRLAADERRSRRYLISGCMTLINRLTMLLEDLGLESGSVWDNTINYYDRLYAFETAAEVRRFVVEIFHSCSLLVSARQQTWNQHIVEKMKTFVQQHYADDITVVDVADMVYLSAGYATTLFRKLTGESLLKYIIRVRIEKAKELLADPSLKLYSVCDRVGYTNMAYFSSIFKNHVGVSLREYRNRILGGGEVPLGC